MKKKQPHADTHSSGRPGFELLHTGRGAARLGLLKTPHGTVATPVFCPVGTYGAVKGVTPLQLAQSGTEMILANAYHLMLRPGAESVQKLGGLHALMGWDGPILTDSGGYQVFSMGRPDRRKVEGSGNNSGKETRKVAPARIDGDAVRFSSHIDGSQVDLDPQKAIKVQNLLGADIIMCLDQCVPLPCEGPELAESVARTVRWAAACKQLHNNPLQMLFGIVQGGIDGGLRRLCATELLKIGFDGYAIGGLSVGEPAEQMIQTVRLTADLLPKELPRYLMGVGMPADIIPAVQAGVDIFDCVLPTRNGRNGSAFTRDGIVRLRSATGKHDRRPIEHDCDCYCCLNFSRGSLRHFFNSSEMLGGILASLHNIRFYQRMMADIRGAIAEDKFEQWAGQWLERHLRNG